MHIAKPWFMFSLGAMFVFCLGGSGQTVSASTESVDSTLREVIHQQQLTGSPGKDLPPPPDIKTSPLAQLGMKLFYSKMLGGQKDAACVSCHHPSLGGGDDLSLPIGIDAVDPALLGPGRESTRETRARVPRNAPTTFNAYFWTKSMFHDGRVQFVQDGKKYGINTPDYYKGKIDLHAGDNLAMAQARFPIVALDEMRGSYARGSVNSYIRHSLAHRFRADASEESNAYWLAEFRKGYEIPEAPVHEAISEHSIARAIAEYEHSQVFIDNPWRDYVLGDDDALSPQAKQGALLFFQSTNQGGAGCSSCHSGDFFTDEQFHNTAMPQIGDGTDVELSNTNDYGRWQVTFEMSDRFKFRTPSLLNAEVTGPWGHDGAYATLEGVVEHMLRPRQAALTYDLTQVDSTIYTTDTLRNNKENVDQGNIEIPESTLDDQQIKSQVDDLTAFLKALTDPRVLSREAMKPWIPGEDQQDPLNLLLIAKDQMGELL